jgi:putative acetyltransferase
MRATKIIRQAFRVESDNIAAIARQSRQHFLPYLADLHTLEDDKGYFRNVVFEQCEVWVVEDANGLVGFCAFKEGWLDHLYFLPTHVGNGLGAALLNKAKESYDHLQLWVFQRNTRAISCYERHGFRKVRETDGAECEEKLPDALYEWFATPGE